MNKKITLLFYIMFFSIVFITGCNSQKEKEIKITYNINDVVISYNYQDNLVITNKHIELITDMEIEGIYYDEEYTKKYNNEKIKKDTILYLKVINLQDNPFPGLSNELYNQIKTDYIKERYGNLYIGIYDDVKINKFIGIFNNSIIASYYCPYGDGIAELNYDNYIINLVHKITIDNIDLWFETTNPIRVYNNSKFYSLEEAYNNKIISFDDLTEISNILKEDISELKETKIISLNNLIDLNQITSIDYLLNELVSLYDVTDHDTITEFYNLFLNNKQVEIINDDNIYESVELVIKIKFNYTDQMTISVTENEKLFISYAGLYFMSKEENVISVEQLKDFIAERKVK